MKCLLALICLPKAPYVVPVNQVMSPITDCGGLHIWKTHATREMNLHHRNAVGPCFFFSLQTCDPLPQMIAELCSLSVLSCHREYVLTLLFNEKHVAIILFYFILMHKVTETFSISNTMLKSRLILMMCMTLYGGVPS